MSNATLFSSCIFNSVRQSWESLHIRHSASVLCVLILLSANALLADTVEESKFDPQIPPPGYHATLFNRTEYPSAKECGTCHVQHFKEWSVSPHAYAQLSPVFGAMHRELVKRTNGTMGDFCIRCHTPVGMQLGEPVGVSNLKRSKISLEGVTCISCHRRSEPLGKVSGRLKIKQGEIFDPVYGSAGGGELERVITSSDFQVNTDPNKNGRDIHTDAIKMDQITTSGFCGSCHDVHSPSGFRLEEAFSEYKSSPAAGNGTSCQDCHMGKEPGVPSGFDIAPVALVGGKPTTPRKRTNHMFVGPDYSVIHPGLFPHNPAADALASMQEWLQFDYKAGWGTFEFEDEVRNRSGFPDRWKSAEARYEARYLLDENIALLETAANERKKLLQKGYILDAITITNASLESIDFDVVVRNGTDGHNVPTGFDAERIVFLRATVRDANGTIVFRSGDLDPNGDLRDGHSAFVHSGKLAEDTFLFSLQSKFLVNMIRGSDREQILNVNYSTSPLPFLRPPTNATSLVGRPFDARKQRRTIPPLSSRTAHYRISNAELENTTPPFNLSVQLIAGMVPVNLIREIQNVGFDYGMSAAEVAGAVVAGYQVLAEKNITITVGTDPEAPLETGNGDN